MFTQPAFIRKWNNPNSDYQINKDGLLKCVSCEEWLPIEYFAKRGDTKRGYKMICKRRRASKSFIPLESEIFKPCVGYEEYAEVSNLGRVLIKERLFDNGCNRYYKPMHLATISKTRYGYSTITLHIKGKTVRLLVHRLVAQAFIPNTHNLPCVNHKDENKFNNSIDNLEWCDREYNNNYGTRNERISIANKGKFTIKMKKHLDNVKENMKTPIAQFDKNGCFIQAYESISEAERALGIRVAYIFHRRKTGAKGFIFKRISKPCFLALAALRDDTDKWQWFCDNDFNWKKRFFICRYGTIKEHINKVTDGDCGSYKDYHKATIEELIEHFKTKNDDNIN